MIKRLLIAITLVLSKLSNVTNATEFGPERAQFIINYQPLDTVLNHSSNLAGDQVYTLVNKKILRLEYPEWDYLLAKTIVDYGDYDNDGYADAIVMGETGGACCGGQLFLVSHRGNQFFSVHKFDTPFGVSDVSLVGNDYLEQIQIKIDESIMPGGGFQKGVYMYQFQNDRLLQVNHSINRAELAAILELNATSLENGPEHIFIDNDSTLDSMVCRRSKPFGFLDCHLILSKFGKFHFPKNCKRVFVSHAITNGVHDIGCNQQTTGKFNGKFFEWEN